MPHLTCPRCKVRCTEADLSGPKVNYRTSRMYWDKDRPDVAFELKQGHNPQDTLEGEFSVGTANKRVCTTCVQEEAFGKGNTTMYRDTYKGKVLDSGFGKKWRRGR